MHWLSDGLNLFVRRFRLFKPELTYLERALIRFKDLCVEGVYEDFPAQPSRYNDP
jgi:hypothetical protein